MTTNQTIDDVPLRAIEWAFERLEICQDQVFQTCECEECEQCGKMPDECSGTGCAKTCQCSTCDHCSNALAMAELRALLDKEVSGDSRAPQPKGEPVAEVVDMKYGSVRFYRKSGDDSKPYLQPGVKLYAEQPAPVAVAMPEFEPAFEKWWEEDGQYCRAGGGSYEKTFAYRAYEAALAEVTRLNTK